MADNFAWTCPYCGQVGTITSNNLSRSLHDFGKGNKYGVLGLLTHVIVCPNSKCGEYAIDAKLYSAKYTNTGTHIQGEAIECWALRPQSSAKVFPDYIPRPILQDYEEACLIKNASPKASATLARRCLQGMIRDFWKISKPRLVDEIDALKEKIDPLTWKAIDAIRRIGNIGAHMEKDINLIVDVDPDEAGKLIALIEMLLKEWYVARHDREEQVNEIIGLAAAKKAAAKEPPRPA